MIQVYSLCHRHLPSQPAHMIRKVEHSRTPSYQFAGCNFKIEGNASSPRSVCNITVCGTPVVLIWQPAAYKSSSSTGPAGMLKPALASPGIPSPPAETSAG
jgi:hypothetical protein